MSEVTDKFLDFLNGAISELGKNRETPHRCPVCNGSGQVPQGFYQDNSYPYITMTTALTQQCRSCEGKGVIWR